MVNIFMIFVRGWSIYLWWRPWLIILVIIML